jgi:hypothetical protein
VSFPRAENDIAVLVAELVPVGRRLEYRLDTRRATVASSTLLHELQVPFGYWEAEEDNDLDKELERKFRRGYPQDNIMFEASREAALVQNRQGMMRQALLASCRFLRATAIQLSICIAFYVNAQAADVIVVSNAVYFAGQPRCTVKLEGGIVDGDLAKLKAAFARVNNRAEMEAGYLCLDSAGGSYQEGLRIADWMLSQVIFTVVQAKEHCFSACALIFMTGGDLADGRSLERYLHPTAVLGFHAPYLIGLPDRPYDKEAVEATYQLGISAIRDLMRLGQRHETPRNFLPQPLLAELLDKGPSEAFVVDTIYKIVQLDIRLFDFREPRPSIEGFGNACMNVAYGNGLDVSLSKPPEAWTARQNNSVKKSGSQLWFAGFGAEGSEYCVVLAPETSSTTFRVSRTLFTPDQGLSRADFRTAHTWFLLPPATPISATIQ